MSNKLLLTAHECAQRTGLTIRALRVYESHGLITPQRSEKGWRLFGYQEIERLNEIISLKNIGMSLREISILLSNHHQTSLDHTLQIQEKTLLSRRDQTDKALQAIYYLRSKLQTGQNTSLEDLLHLVKEAHSPLNTMESNIWRSYTQARPRQEIMLDPHEMHDLVGTWEFNDGSIIQTVLRHHELYYLHNQFSYRLLPEAPDQFFIKGMAIQIHFQRTALNSVETLQHHQNGIIETATRVADSKAKEQLTALKEKIKTQQPHLKSKIALHQLLLEQAQKIQNHSSMTPLLAQVIAEQKDYIHAAIHPLGNLNQLIFQSIAQNGLEMYHAEFDHGKLECGISLTQSDQIGAFYIYPILDISS